MTKDKRIIVGDVKRMRGRPDAVAKLVLETARGDTNRVKIAMARDPGQAGIAQQEFYTRLLAGYTLDFSPESERLRGHTSRSRPYRPAAISWRLLQWA